MVTSKRKPLKMIIKTGENLTDKELSQIKEAISREFKVLFKINDETKDRLFFLLKQKNTIVAMGAFWKVKPVIFNGENFVIYALLNVIANIKGKGYGKQVVTTMRKYLVDRNKTIFGFCMPNNTGFYKKCGFNIDTVSTQRFVYIKDRERITNKDGQYIFYQDSSGNFMEKVLAIPNQEVSIPTEKLW